MILINGLIGSVHSGSFLSRAIQLFMKIWNKRNGYPIKNVDSHSFMVLGFDGMKGLQVIESNEWGPEINDWHLTGYGRHKNVTLMEPVEPWTREELEKMAIRGREFTDPVCHYDVFNFLHQMHMICSPEKEWKGPRGKLAEKRVYCSELVAYLLNSSGREFFPEPWAVNPEDIKHHPWLKIYKP